MARRSKKTEISPLVFDTDVLIWYFRGSRDARLLLEQTDSEKRWVSALSMMELLQGSRNKKELIEIQSFIAENFSRVLHPRTSISEKAIHWVGEYSISHGLRVIDALIAASALLHKAILVTGNAKHFSFIPGVKIQKFVV